MENIKTKRSKSTRSRTSEQPETSIVLESETVETEVNPMQEVEPGLVHYGPEVIEVVQSESDTGEVSDQTKLEVEEPECDVSQLESPLTIISPIPAPPSPRRKIIITTG